MACSIGACVNVLGAEGGSTKRLLSWYVWVGQRSRQLRKAWQRLPRFTIIVCHFLPSTQSDASKEIGNALCLDTHHQCYPIFRQHLQPPDDCFRSDMVADFKERASPIAVLCMRWWQTGLLPSGYRWIRLLADSDFCIIAFGSFTSLPTLLYYFECLDDLDLTSMISSPSALIFS